MKFSRLVKSFVPYEELKQMYPSLSAEQVVEWMINHRLATKDTSRFADLIEKAIQNQNKISIWYSAAEDNFVEEKRQVTPLAFQVKRPKHENQEFIYLVAYNFEGGVRTYRFDRLNQVKTVSLPGKYPGKYDTYYNYYEDIEPDFYNSEEDLPDYSKDILPDNYDPSTGLPNYSKDLL